MTGERGGEGPRGPDGLPGASGATGPRGPPGMSAEPVADNNSDDNTSEIGETISTQQVPYMFFQVRYSLQYMGAQSS